MGENRYFSQRKRHHSQDENFTDAHVVFRTLPYIRVVYPTNLIYWPLPWQRRGLQTASGYGSKLTSEYKLSFNNRLYSCMHTLLRQHPTAYIIASKRRIYLS